MDAPFSFNIEARGDYRVEIELRGRLTEIVLADLVREVESRLSGWRDRVWILWDMRGVKRCEFGARQVLLALQRKIAASGAHRTAFLTSRPRIAGVVLWISHMSQDGNARPVVNLGQAEDWFERDVDRVDELERVGTRTASRVASQQTRRGGKR